MSNFMLNYKKKILYIVFNILEYYYIHIIIIYYIMQKVNIFRITKTWKNSFNSIFRTKYFFIILFKSNNKIFISINHLIFILIHINKFIL